MNDATERAARICEAEAAIWLELAERLESIGKHGLAEDALSSKQICERLAALIREECKT